MSPRGRRWPSLVLAALALAASSRAEDAPIRLDDITVEASPIDAYLPARTTLDRNAIIDSHKSELSDVLELTPGINVREGGRGEARVDMRGFDQRATLFTLNGVPVFEPYNGIINVDLFPLEMLGGVEIVRGVSSSLYGPNGMAGQIKLTTFGTTAPLAAAASTIWRDADLWDTRASLGGRREGFSTFLAGRYLTSPNYTLSGDFDARPPSRRRGEDGGKRLNSDEQQASGFATVGYDTAAGGRLHVAVLGSDASFGIPPSTTQFLPIYRRTEQQRLLHVQGGAEQRVAPAVGVSGGVFYTRYDATEGQYDGPDFDTLLLTSTADSSDLGGIGRVTIDLGDTDTFAVGGQARYDAADISNSVRGAIDQPEFVITSLGAENVWLATERLSLIVGLSWDVLSGGGAPTTDEVNPQGVVSYDWQPWGVSRVAVGRKIRFPTLRELFDPLQGNPDLRPEATLTYEIGHQVGRDWGYAGMNLFRSDVEDLIESGGGDPPVFMNIQSATLQGVEVIAGVEPLAGIRLDVNYTYLNTSASDADRLGRNAESAVQHKPANRFNGILQIALPWQLLIRSEGLYTAEQLDAFGSDVYVDGFALWNIQLTRGFGDWLRVFAGCDNLLDTDYEQKLGSPEPGRRAFVGLRATY